MIHLTAAAALCLFFALAPLHVYAQSALITTRDDLHQRLSPVPRSVQDVPAPAIITSTPPQPNAALPVGSSKFALNEVVFKNLQAYDPAALRDIWDEYTGQHVTLRELTIIANRTQERYRKDGYLATRVLLEPQTVTGGRVVLSVFEGRLANVVVTSELGTRGEAVKRRILALSDRSGALKTADIERALLLVRDIPGINVSARLVPTSSDVIGGLDLELDVIDKRFGGFANLQNFGSEETGEFLATAGVDINGVFAPTDRLRVIGLAEPTGPEQANGLIEYEIRPGISGLALRAGASYGVNNPGGVLEPLDLDGESLIIYAEGEYPLIRSQRKNLFAVLGAEYSNQKSDSGNVEIIDDTVITIYGKLKGNLVSDLVIPSASPGVTTAIIEVRRGVGGSDNSDLNLSRIDGESEFTTVRGKLSHTQPLYADLFELYLDGRVQYSDSPLLAYEEMSLGGLTIGRGYDPGVLSGDDGHAGTVELRVRPALFSNNIFQRTEFFTFYDFGVVSNQDSDSLDDQTISSIGGGVRVQAPQLVEESTIGGAVELTYAKALEPALSTSSEKPDGRFLINLSVFW